MCSSDLRLTDRGRVAPGMKADLMIFNPATVADRSTFEQPRLPATGMAYVFVNGRPVWTDGHATGERPGVLLRR